MKFNEAVDNAKENILLEIVSEKYAKYIETHTINDIIKYNSKIINVETKNGFIPTDCGSIGVRAGNFNGSFHKFLSKVLELTDFSNAEPAAKRKIGEAVNDFGKKIKKPILAKNN